MAVAIGSFWYSSYGNLKSWVCPSQLFYPYVGSINKLDETDGVIEDVLEEESMQFLALHRRN